MARLMKAASTAAMPVVRTTADIAEAASFFSIYLLNEFARRGDMLFYRQLSRNRQLWPNMDLT
jgi:hypothetical protein